MVCTLSVRAQDTVENYIREYPNQEQVRMMRAWLQDHEKGTFHFTGLVEPSDDTVVPPQATVDYGYNWFNVSDGPAIVRAPSYDRFFSVSIFGWEAEEWTVPLNLIVGQVTNVGPQLLQLRGGVRYWLDKPEWRWPRGLGIQTGCHPVFPEMTDPATTTKPRLSMG